VEHAQQDLVVYGYDRAGNRSEPVRLAVTVDNVAPVVTVHPLATEALLLQRTPVLEGAISDSGGAVRVNVKLLSPSGNTRQEAVEIDGSGAWRYELAPASPGAHLLWVNATDQHGNSTVAGPYLVNTPDAAVDLVHRTWLPVAVRTD
jgi:hypothetical protein